MDQVDIEVWIYQDDKSGEWIIELIEEQGLTYRVVSTSDVRGQVPCIRALGQFWNHESAIFDVIALLGRRKRGETKPDFHPE
jgi:hypothetical protein